MATKPPTSFLFVQICRNHVELELDIHDVAHVTRRVGIENTRGKKTCDL